MVIVCSPLSAIAGVHEKFPDALTVTFATEEPLKESPTLKVGLVNPVDVKVKENFVPANILLPGETDWIEIEGGGNTVTVCVTFALPPV